MNEWLRASGNLNGYSEFVHLNDDSSHYYFDEEVWKAEEGLMTINEWPDSKWETIMSEK